MLKQTVGNANRRSAHYTKQAPFEGSDRQIRGEVLRLLNHQTLSEGEIVYAINRNADRVSRTITDLCAEGFLVRDGDILRIG
jgi:A/G-specific adenine glycosylase